MQQEEPQLKTRNHGLMSLTRDLPGICIVLQTLAAILLTGFLTWLFVTSELL